MNVQQFNLEEWQRPAERFKALGHPVRLWIAQQLMGGEHSVHELVESTNLDFSTISQHLTVMKNAGVVETKKEGKLVFYSLRCECVRKFLECLAEHRNNRAKCLEQ